MTPTARLTHALRSLADALEGPLPCSDPEMPARRILSRLETVRDWTVRPDYRLGAAADIALVLEVTAHGKDALDALCDAGLCDE